MKQLEVPIEPRGVPAVVRASPNAGMVLFIWAGALLLIPSTANDRVRSVIPSGEAEYNLATTR